LSRATAMILCWQRCDKTFSFGKSYWGLPVGTTHIIIGAVSAIHGDIPAAKLEEEKGQGIECHGWERGGVVAISPGCSYFIDQGPKAA